MMNSYDVCKTTTLELVPEGRISFSLAPIEY